MSRNWVLGFLLAVLSTSSLKADTTVTVGTLSLNGIDRGQFSFAYSVPTYQDGSYYTIYFKGAEDAPKIHVPWSNKPVTPAFAQRIPNLGGQVNIVNESHINIRLTIAHWTTVPGATVTIQLGSQSKTAHQSDIDVVFADVPQTTQPFSITINGALVPGLLPLAINSSVEGFLHPRYYILTVVYAPPGTDGGKSSSFVDYGTGSSTGTVMSTSSSFKQGLDIKAEGSGGFLGNVSVDADFKASNTDADSSSLAVKKAQNYDIKVSGPSKDGINHDYDLFYLWLNPLVSVSIDHSDAVKWGLGVDGSTMDIQYVYAAWLKDPTLLPSGLRQKFAAAGMTTADYATILSADPFTSGATEIDQNRFRLTTRSYAYEPPFSPTSPVPTTTFDQTSSVTNTTSHESQFQYAVSAGVSVSVGEPTLFQAKLSTTASLEWTNKSSNEQSSSSSQSATVSIGGPAYGYPGPTDVLVYVDTVYNTFMFAFPQQAPALSGLIGDPSGQAIANAAVTLKIGEHTFTTYTGLDGRYRFYGIPEGQGTLKVDADEFPILVSAAAAKRDFQVSH